MKKLYEYLYFFSPKVNIIFGKNLLEVKNISEVHFLLGQKILLYVDDYTECEWISEESSLLLETISDGIGVVLLPTIPTETIITLKAKNRLFTITKKIKVKVFHSEAIQLNITVDKVELR